jgi:hypothetical protein
MRWGIGIFPALLRLGNGLANRKIAVFAKGDNLVSLRDLLLDSHLFSKSNIIDITKKNDISRAQSASVFLVFWHDWIGDIQEIFAGMKESSALVVYAPYDKGPISDENMTFLDGRRHTAVTNFRGRLLNDIVVSMITTGYEQR